MVTETERKAKELWRSICERLPPPEAARIRELLSEFKAKKITRTQVLTSVPPLLENHHDLLQRFQELADEDGEEGDDYDDSETEQVGDEDGEEGDDSETEQVVEKPKETATRVIKMNENSLGKIKKKKKGGILKLKAEQVTPEEIWEDEIYEADMLIEAARSVEEKVRKVIQGEMRMEDLDDSEFNERVTKLFRRNIVTQNVRGNDQEALPSILVRIQQKVEDLVADRDSKKSGLKKN